MRRRVLLATGLATPAILMGNRVADAAVPDAKAGKPTPFDANTVRAIARDLAAKPFAPAETALPDVLANLSYDRYRAIRFDPARSLWRGTGLPFEAEFFHRGFLYKDRVDINVVADGQSTPIAYNPDLFDFGPTPRPNAAGLADVGFAGFRIHAPFMRPDYADEFCVFLGASYFRALAKGQTYGLSARGLAIDTGDSRGEEFPSFREFWLERPQPGASALVIHALLESPSATGAYRFTVRPGDETIMDVESVVFPRVDIDQVGLATLTSMFTFGPASHTGFDDWRPAVHDSEGLQIWTGRGEHVWRPLANPRTLQVSVFGDLAPRGFGLMQRSRKFTDYEDLETDYELRPSLWVEPIGAPGEGAVVLVEIPTRSEVHDNIVAFWRPKNPLKAKSENGFTYRLHWGDRAPIAEDVARVVGTFTGVSFSGKTREFVLDISGGKLKADSKPRLEVTSDHGAITVPSVVLNTAKPNDTWRASFELDPQGAPVVELRGRLVDDGGPLSETWLYRWTPA